MKDEALRLALEALKKCDSALAEELAAWDIDPPLHHVLEASNACGPAITAIKQALEQPEPEPVAWGVDWGNAGDSPCVSIIKRLPDGVIEVVAVEYGPQRKPLTDEEIWNLAANCLDSVAGRLQFARAIEAAHGIKGEA